MHGHFMPWTCTKVVPIVNYIKPIADIRAIVPQYAQEAILRDEDVRVTR